MRQRADQPVEFPHDQHVAGLDEFEHLRQTGTVILRAGGMILEKVTGIDAGGQQRVALQVRTLPESDDTCM